MSVRVQSEDFDVGRELEQLGRGRTGIGAVVIGEGDLSQELGYPRQVEHPAVLEAMAEIVAICKECNVVVGHPHVEISNGQRVVDEGYRFLMCSAPRSFNTLEKSRTLVGR